ncbi:3-ketoacyl-CoA thiolase [Aphelenchoides avenae]|nr:3-ketoacyl-CoA thiolase [Aphelenchus avenae]
MTQVPFVVRNARFGIPVGTDLVLEDYLGQNNLDPLVGMNMPQTAELLAEKYGIKREECDEYALESQKRWKKAKESGVFDAEVEPIDVKRGKTEEAFDTDENPRETSLVKLGQLKPYVKKDGIGMGDGAGAVLLASESSVSRLGLRPLARVVDYQVAGCDPKLMGIAPVHAIRALCERASVPLEKVDLIETNEAFAAQVLAVQKELGLEKGRLNQDGGAIALGHPFAASGARIVGHLAHGLR